MRYCSVFVVALAMFVQQARADILNLTTAGSSGFLNGAFFQQMDAQSTGTGVIGTFVRIQNDETESGYNTDGALEFDTKAGSHTHSLLLSAIPIVNIGGIDYRQFLLDIDEKNNDSGHLLSLNEIKIHQADVGDLTGYPGGGFGARRGRFDFGLQSFFV